jgi:hypothetical protein
MQEDFFFKTEIYSCKEKGLHLSRSIFLQGKKNFSSQEVLKPGLTLAPIISGLPMLLSRQTSSCSCMLGMSLHHPGMAWSYLSVATVLAAVAVLVDSFTSLIVK